MLLRGTKVIGTLLVTRGCAVVELDGEAICAVPAISGTPMTEADIDATAAFITEAAGRT